MTPFACPKPLSLRRCAAFGAFFITLGSGPLSAEEASSLRLTASGDGQSLQSFSVVEGAIVVSDRTMATSVPRGSHWQLQGDFRANRHYFHFAPHYQINVRAVPVGAAGERTITVADVMVSRAGPWEETALANGILVVAWIVDGRVASVRVAPASVRKNSSGGYAAIVPVYLSPGMEKGAPVVLLYKEGRFLPPETQFARVDAQTALMEFHFGSQAEVANALGALRSVNVVTSSRATLLQFCTAGGFTDATRTLLERRAWRSNASVLTGTPLHAAAENGRTEIVRLLVTGKAPILERPDRKTPLMLALDGGHVESAQLLLREKWDASAEQLLGLAIEQGKTSLLREILQRPGARLPPNATARWQRRVAELKDAELDAILAPAGFALATASEVQDRQIYHPENVTVPAELVTPLRVLPGVNSKPDLRREYSSRPMAVQVPGGGMAMVTAGTVETRVQGYETTSAAGEWATATLVVEADGTPSSGELIESSNAIFAQRVLAALAKSRFLPGEREGKPVRTRIVLSVSATEE